MPHSLPTRLRLALLLLLALLVRPALATHLLGGEMTYRYLDSNGSTAAPLHYEITVTIYNNSLQGAVQPNTNAPVGIYDLATGARIYLLQGVNLLAGAGAVASGGFMDITNYTISPVLAPAVPLGCAVSGPSQPFRLQKFVAQVYLPVTVSGFYAVFTRSSRNIDITNLNTASNNTPLSLYATLSPPLRPNRSPVFSDTAVAIVCQNDTTISLNNAVDADGDRLVYSFGSPYGTFSNPTGSFGLPAAFPPLPNTVAYNNGYSTASPFGTGAGNFALLNASTGVARYGARTQGKYVVAVDVQEYRTINGREVLIGTTRRDLQLIVASCPSTAAPVLPVAANLPRAYTIEEGQSLTINFSATQAAGNPLVMTVNSALLDGAGDINATFNGSQGTVATGSLTGTATATGSGTVAGAFVYNSACGQGRANPYDIAVTVQDRGCGGKIIADVFRVTVVKPSGPTAVAGDLAICGVPSTHSYTASGGTAPGISWRVVGGTIVGSRTANPVQVNWTAASGGTLVARGVSQYGCLTDSVTQNITVTPGPTLTVSGNLTICQGASTTITVSGAGTGVAYTVTGGPVTGAGPNFVLTPTQTTTYTINAPVVANGCAVTTQVTVTVNPAAAANVGAAARATCSGTTITLGAAAVTGSTYSWSPATGLSSSTAANPTVTLTNSTGAPITQTYTLTETTSAGCSATNSVAITVNPAVTAAPGPAVTICSGGSATLGAAPVAGYTYSWSPATGLSSSTVANPTVTLTNTTSAPITQTYTLTTTDPATGCASTATVVVTVNPAVVAVPGAAVAICSGASATLGAAPVAGYTYSWSPATGLSSSTVANPTVTLTNTTSAPITQTYTLTTTDPATGCVNTATVVVTVNPAAIANAGAAQALCADQTVTLGTPGLAGYTYQWTPAANLSSATAAQPVLTGVNPTAAPLVLSYSVLATTAQGCTATSTVQITVNPRPATDSIAGAQSVCPTITGIAYNIRNPHSLSYQWTVAGGTIASGQGTAAITVNWGPAGTGSVSAYASNVQGCNSNVYALPVRINQVLQTVKPSGPASVCQADGPYAYSTQAVNGSSFAWQLFGTAAGTLISTGNTTSINFTSVGMAKLVVTQTSSPAGGICRGVSDTLYITVKPSPSTALTIQGPARFCFNSGSQAYTLPGATGSTYVFQLNGTTIANVNGTATLPATTAVGTYTLTARETSSGGCVGVLYSKTFTVDPQPGVITINGPRFVCPATRTLTYTVPNATGTSTYQWTVTGGTIASGQGTATITVTFPAALTTNATVSVSETSQFGCGGAAVSATVVPDNAQAPQLTLASVVATDNTKVTLTFSVANPANTPGQVQVLRREAGSTGAYATVGTVAPGATSFTDATPNAAQTAYQYALNLTNGCGDLLAGPTPHTTTLLKAVAVPGAPNVPRSQGGTSLSWTAYQGFMVASYQVYQQLDNGGYSLLATVSGSTLTYNVPNTGQGFAQCYRVVAASGDAQPRLANSNTACVEFTNGLAFYNVITPNNDGQNDKLEILNVQLYPGNTMEIYNRWGRQVYSTTNYNNDNNYWGTDPSIAPGVYYYLFKQANGNATKGWVEVVK